jgi:Reverse transcriptase (RNA-dependent DNA polymerase)
MDLNKYPDSGILDSSSYCLIWFRDKSDDECIYHKFSESKIIFLILYIDDILLATNNINILRKIKKFLYRYFQMKDIGKTSYVLGLKIH